MEKFGFSGLWKHLLTTVPGLGIMLADALLSYFNKIDLPAWAHILVVVVGAALAAYKGKKAEPAAAA